MSSPRQVLHPRVRSWLSIREPLESQLEPLGRIAMRKLGLAAGDHVLDIGCGIGGTPSSLAQAVGPTGTVTCIEPLADAIAVLRSDPGLPPNVDFICADAQSHAFEHARFDSIFTRFGVMFFADALQAFANIRCALRPEGNLAFVCWREFEANELDTLPVRSAVRYLPAELVRDAAAATCFSLSAREIIEQPLAAAGFIDIEVEAKTVPVSAGDLQKTIEVCTTVGALGAMLRERPSLKALAIPALQETLSPLDGPTGLWLQAAVWIVSARAPRCVSKGRNASSLF